MNILGFTSTQSAYGTTISQKIVKPVAGSVSGRYVGTDSVNISDAARAMAEKAGAGEGGEVKNGTTSIGPPVDDCYSPDWVPDNYDSPRNREALMYIPEALNNIMPPTFVYKNYDSLGKLAGAPGGQPPEELKKEHEYVKTVEKVFREERHKRGVLIEDYRQLAGNNDKMIGEINQAVRTRLAADPHIMELAKQLGVKL